MSSPAAGEPQSSDCPPWLALHIRRLRQWAGDEGLSQIELAERTGLSPSTIRNLEHSTSLPKHLESLLRVAIALDVPVEKLVDPRYREQLQRQVESHDDAEACPSCEPFCPLIAVIYRSPYLVIAIMHDGEPLEVQRVRVHDENHTDRVLERIVSEYGCRTIAVEPDSHLPKHVERLQCDVRTLSIEAAKRALVPGTKRPTHRQLYQHLIARYPYLGRFVTVLPATGRVAMSERWRIVQLLPIALGIAADRFKLGDPHKKDS